MKYITPLYSTWLFDMLPIKTTIQVIKNASSRAMSSTQSLVSTVIDDSTGVATVTMQRPPVNSLNLELLDALSKSFDELKKNKSRGMILTSALPTVFSGGLDIMEMYKPEKQRVEAFWKTLQDVWLKLYGSTYPTAAAINGHSPAGGCLLAMSCEYRVMVNGKYTIGLNETALGIVAPYWFQATMKNTIPNRIAEQALTTGRMFTVDEALSIGLIDETATDKAECISKCGKFLSQFAKISPGARAKTKLIFRQDDLEYLIKNREADMKMFCDVCFEDKTQKDLEAYINALKQKKKSV